MPCQDVLSRCLIAKPTGNNDDIAGLHRPNLMRRRSTSALAPIADLILQRTKCSVGPKRRHLTINSAIPSDSRRDTSG